MRPGPRYVGVKPEAVASGEARLHQLLQALGTLGEPPLRLRFLMRWRAARDSRFARFFFFFFVVVVVVIVVIVIIVSWHVPPLPP